MQSWLAGRTAFALDICQGALPLKGPAHSFLAQGTRAALQRSARGFNLREHADIPLNADCTASTGFMISHSVIYSEIHLAA